MKLLALEDGRDEQMCSNDGEEHLELFGTDSY